MAKRYLVEWSCEQEWAVRDWCGQDDVYVVLASDFDAQVDAGMKLFEENERLRARLSQLEAALKVCHQALIETAHAQEVGSSWYTRGADGLYRQVHMWVRKGLGAIKACAASET